MVRTEHHNVYHSYKPIMVRTEHHNVYHSYKPIMVRLNIVHLLTGCEWNSCFIQAEAETIPRGLARGELFMSKVELKNFSTQNQ